MKRASIKSATATAGPAESRRRARQGWAFMRKAMSPHWAVLGLAVGAALVSSAAIASTPLLLGNAVNEGLLAHRWRSFTVYVVVIAVWDWHRRLLLGAGATTTESPRGESSLNYAGISMTTSSTWTSPTTPTSTEASFCLG